MKKFLKEIIDGKPTNRHIQDVNLLTALKWIANSWDEVNPYTIQSSWKKLLPEPSTCKPNLSTIVDEKNQLVDLATIATERYEEIQKLLDCAASYEISQPENFKELVISDMECDSNESVTLISHDHNYCAKPLEDLHLNDQIKVINHDHTYSEAAIEDTPLQERKQDVLKALAYIKKKKVYDSEADSHVNYLIKKLD